MKFTAIIIAILFLLGPLWTQRLAPNVYEGGRSQNVRDRVIRNSSAVAVILGEARAATSDMLFIKTERYLDYGVAYEPHLADKIQYISGEAQDIAMREIEAESHTGEAHDHAHDHGDEHGTPKTIIRTADRDFRGIVGDLERRVQPWRDPSLPHQHASGAEMLPWYRVMTLADPNNGRAYAIGSWWLKQKDHDQALAFVEEGLKHNPEYFQLWYTHGVLLYEKGRKILTAAGEEAGIPPEAQALFNRAKESCLKATEIGLRRRPAGWLPPENEDDDAYDLWTLYEEEDVRAAARFAMLIERNYGDKRKALALAADLDKRLDGDYILARQIPLLNKAIAAGHITQTTPEEWAQQLVKLDTLAEEAAYHLDELNESGARSLAARLAEAAETVAVSAFPPDVTNPAMVELAQFDLLHAIEKLGDLASAPLATLRQGMIAFHPIVEKLMVASGLEHAHEGEHAHDDTHDDHD